MANRLRSLRGPGESSSDVILRLARPEIHALVHLAGRPVRRPHCESWRDLTADWQERARRPTVGLQHQHVQWPQPRLRRKDNSTTLTYRTGDAI